MPASLRAIISPATATTPRAYHAVAEAASPLSSKLAAAGDALRRASGANAINSTNIALNISPGAKLIKAAVEAAVGESTATPASACWRRRFGLEALAKVNGDADRQCGDGSLLCGKRHACAINGPGNIRNQSPSHSTYKRWGWR